MVRGHSPVLGLDLCWDDGRLRYYDPVADRWLMNQMEEHAAREYAEARLAEMEAELRRLRGE